jgi:hypothetical protein
MKITAYDYHSLHPHDNDPDSKASYRHPPAVLKSNSEARTIGGTQSFDLDSHNFGTGLMLRDYIS